MTRTFITANHWGIANVESADGRIQSAVPHPVDPDPSRISENLAASLSGSARVQRPAFRRGWLDHGPGAAGGRRGRDEFVEVGWDEALERIAGELTRLRRDFGNGALFAGSYGWSSAGRFHHAQSQLKRFLNTIGGFVRSEGNYSYNAALVLMPHILGSYRDHVAKASRWSTIARHSDLVVMFGGMAMRNAQVSDGGIGRHLLDGNLQACAEAGVRFVNLSPMRCDAADALNAEWLALRPGSDTAVMLALAHTLYTERLHDTAFLDRYTTGFARFVPYLTGQSDGQPKDADWAAAISGLEAGRLRDLARQMAASRCFVTCAAGVQRADHGEQPLWMAVTLGAMLGQIGLPGGGFGIGHGVNGTVGNMERPFRWGSYPQGANPVDNFIPVAMISEMLLNPGQTYRYDGHTRVFPNIRAVWWAGGNPFHHHQDLNRLRDAFQRPETIIVNEMNWTATARHADIVLPVAAAQERTDFAAGHSDNMLIPMQACAEPPGLARAEYDIYADLAARMGTAQAFTEGLDSDGWLRRIWAETQATAASRQIALPDWDDFLNGEPVLLPDPAPERTFLSEFRADPDAFPLPTPSGRIEIFSDAIAGFGIPGWQGHPVYLAPHESGEGPFHLLSGQPRTRLHSQLDNGAYSMSMKIDGREPVLMHPSDAGILGLTDGEVVELSSTRGCCLAGLRISEDVRPGCLFLWTGAWYDPDFDHPRHRDRHGNPNVLTHDLRTSELAQGPASHSCRVAVRRLDTAASAVMAHVPPRLVSR